LVLSLKLTGTVVPYFGILGREGILECHFDLETESLYSLKWYKDGHEFFRFKPNPSPNPAEPPITIFPLDGVFVNVSTQFYVLPLPCTNTNMCTYFYSWFLVSVPVSSSSFLILIPPPLPLE
jgi:hypothetical protein